MRYVLIVLNCVIVVFGLLFVYVFIVSNWFQSPELNNLRAMKKKIMSLDMREK
jgi:hypothetical protein